MKTRPEWTTTRVLVSLQWAVDHRLRRGLSQREVAKRMGVSASYLCDIEAGKRPFHESLWTRYEAALKS